MDATLVLGSCLVASIALQLAAAGLALRLIPLSRGRLAWILVSVALLLMSVRRSLTLARLVSGANVSVDPWAEAVALTISALMAGGVFLIAPLFTERAKLEARLRQAEKLEAIGRLAGGIAHDFNNQLLVIMGYADELSSGLAGQPLRRSAEMILSAAERSAALTRNLLAFARKSGPSTRFDVHRLIREVEILLSRTIDRRIEIWKELGAEAAVVVGDPAQLQSALLNLALNARDAMPRGGRLTFSTRCVVLGASDERRREMGLEPGRHLVIAVADTGTGIDPEARAHLFEPFFTTKTAGKGTGLGLASVYGSVRAANGAVQVDSSPGSGATFSLYLPVAPEAKAEGPVPIPEPPSPAAATAGSRVLVVEDEEEVRKLIVAMLSKLGHQAVACSDGAEAATLFERTSRELDLVILDGNMPRMDGAQTLAALTSIDPAVRIIVCSGNGADSFDAALAGSNVLGYLHKPFLLAELSEMVGRAVPCHPRGSDATEP